MKKFGFTLAEILITLGIVGVIAAITLPTLNTSTAHAQIGPKLAKAVSMFDQANQALLEANSADRITDIADLANNTANYSEALTNFIKMTPVDYPVNHASDGQSSAVARAFRAKDGIVYLISSTGWEANNLAPAHQTRLGVVWIDINGTPQPNTLATDVFVFALMHDGSLQPLGGEVISNNATHWTNTCAANTIPANPIYCAGHVFENNLRVSYR